MSLTLLTTTALFALLLTICGDAAHAAASPIPPAQAISTHDFQGATLEGGAIYWGGPDDTTRSYADITLTGNLTLQQDDSGAGLLVRADRHGGSGYWACLRHPKGASYAVVQLFRLPELTLLQEARVAEEFKSGRPISLKITCQGPHLWVWAGSLLLPAITEFDDTHTGSGAVGLKSESRCRFGKASVEAGGATPRAPYVADWSGVRGAVFITSESVNSYQMWEEYHPAVIDRELSYAHASGLNTVQVYLDFLNWQKDGPAYLARIEDFLRRADKHGLKVTFIFFDDIGNIEPPHLAPYGAPLPGIHNSQMQGCPGRDIIDNHYAEYRARLKAYVQAVVRAHRADPRISFWQTYNEPSHASTLPLLADAYQWVKETGSTIPVTATGGGAFYGSYYSDFPSFHSYLDPQAPASEEMVLAGGGSEHLCTETLDRPGVDIPKLTKYFAAHKTGWVIWELMIGRDNCRFPWGSPAGAPEPAIPFHGLLYPDGHPWSAGDIAAIRAVTPAASRKAQK